jgi:hypothetical protein
LCEVHAVSETAVDRQEALFAKCTELLQACLSINPYYYKAHYWLARSRFSRFTMSDTAGFQSLIKAIAFDDNCLVCHSSSVSFLESQQTPSIPRRLIWTGMYRIGGESTKALERYPLFEDRPGRCLLHASPPLFSLSQLCPTQLQNDPTLSQCTAVAHPFPPGLWCARKLQVVCRLAVPVQIAAFVPTIRRKVS